MSDDKRNEPIKDETLDKVSGGYEIDHPANPMPKSYGPPPVKPPTSIVPGPEPC